MVPGATNPYTAEQLQQFKVEYKARKRRQWIISGSAVVVVFAAMAGRNGLVSQFGNISKDDVSKGILGLAVVMVLLSFRNWRCPACAKYLGKSMGLKFCGKCGIPLDG